MRGNFNIPKYGSADQRQTRQEVFQRTGVAHSVLGIYVTFGLQQLKYVAFLILVFPVI